MKPNRRPQTLASKKQSPKHHGGHQNRKQPNNKQKARQDKRKETLVFDPSERVDFVKGFQKRKQERRDRAKLEAAEQEREIRKLLRQKRREAVQRSRDIASANSGHGNEAGGGSSDDDDDGKMKPDGVSEATVVGLGGVKLPPSLNSGDIE